MVKFLDNQAFKRSYKVLKNNLKEIITAIVVVIAPGGVALMSLVMGHGLINSFLAVKIVWLVFVVAAVILTFILTLGYAKNIMGLYSDRSMDWRTIFADGRSVALHMTWVTFCYWILSMVTVLVLVAVLVVLAFITKLLSVPTIIAYVVLGLFACCSFCIGGYYLLPLMYAWFDALENPCHSFMKSCTISWNLTKGKYMEIFRYLAPIVFISVLIKYFLQGTIFLLFSYISANVLFVIRSTSSIFLFAVSLVIMVFIVGMYDELKKSV
jgi:hypothetical protein